MRGSNITSDPETGIGSWSEADVKRALTEGVRPSGVPLAPQMPVAFYKILTPRDLDAVLHQDRGAGPQPGPAAGLQGRKGRSPRRHATFDGTVFSRAAAPQP